MSAKKKQFSSTVNYIPNFTRFEKNSGEIVTVTGETYTIQELYARHNKGSNPNLDRQTYFEDTEDFDMPDLSKINQLDLVERSELYSEVEKRAKLARKQLEERIKEEDAKEVVQTNERSVETKDDPSATESKALPEDSTS